MSSNAYVAYVEKNNSIKSVYVHFDGYLDSLGIQLNDYFRDLSDVKDLVVSSISSVEDGEVTFMDNLSELTEDDYEYYFYDNKDDFVGDMNGHAYYYLFENESWFVSKPGQNEFKELESVLEEEF